MTPPRPRPSNPPPAPKPPAGPDNPKPPAGPKGEAQRMYSVKALADLWDLSVRHIYNLIASGELAAVDTGHGRAKTRIPASAADAYIAARLRRAPRGRAA